MHLVRPVWGLLWGKKVWERRSQGINRLSELLTLLTFFRLAGAPSPLHLSLFWHTLRRAKYQL